MLQIGQIFDNKYKILSEVGHGGMSVVYLALNERANKTWAIKEVRKDGVVDFESVKQGLVVETDMLKKLNHPNLPSIIDVIDTDDSFVIVMDYIEGASLQKLLKTQGAQPEEKVIKWAKQLCDVLSYLHRQTPPIIYRDMKPSNVMLKPDGNVTLIDFGTAREFKNRAMVEDTTCLGTRGYAAPEQFGGRGQTDGRTDIYCLGATIYHLLTGHSPAEPPYEIKPLSYWIPQYAGSGLEKLIAKCTRQDPADRYQNCEELMYALVHYKDEDEAALRVRKQQWNVFLAGLILGFVGLVGFFSFRLVYSNAKKATLDSYLEQAMQQTELIAAKPYIKSALELNPGDGDVYRVLMEKLDGDIVSSALGQLPSTSASVMNECLNSTGSGGVSNVNALKEEDPAAYTELMYEMGIRYFFMRGDTDANRKEASDKYLSNIQDEAFLQYLTPAKRELAKMLYDISGYIGQLGNDMNKFTDSEASYSSFFEDISQLAQGDLKSKVEKDIYVIRIYQQVAVWIDSKGPDFYSDGVAPAQMRAVLDTVDAGLEGLSLAENNANYGDYLGARDAVTNARDTVTRLEGRG